MVLIRSDRLPGLSNLPVSVCMATYNGELFVKEQIESILPQLDSSDELVIVDDASTDNTRDILQSINDARVSIIDNVINLGPVRSFERAIAIANGGIIILSDQDDIWPEGRVLVMRNALQGSALLVAGGLEVFGDNRRPDSIHFTPGTQRSWRNIVGILMGQRPYYGSALAFRSEIKSLLMPFPRWVEAHDHWIAIVANVAGQCKHLPNVVTLRREHDRNLTSPRRRNMRDVVRTRCLMIAQITVALGRFTRSAGRGQSDRGKLRDKAAASPPRVEFVNYFFAHYREAVMRECENTAPFAITWVSGSRQINGIPHAQLSHFASVVECETISVPGNLKWQHGIVGRSITGGANCVVYTGDPTFISTWIAAVMSRARGVRVLMWTHGWTHADRGLKRLVRVMFYNLAHSLIIYTDEGMDLGRNMGYSKPIHVVYNSMDVSTYCAPRFETSVAGRPQRWCVVSRLIGSRHIEQVVEAVAYLQLSGRKVALTIIGEGPERDRLEAIVLDRQLEMVQFLGATYVPAEVNAVLQESDVLVSPGHVGLAAIHALSNGCPVATHDDPDHQYPEHVAVTPRTGVRFTRGDFRSLAEETWNFVDNLDPSHIFKECRDEVALRWTAEAHASKLIKAVEEELDMVHFRSRFGRLRSAIVRQVGPVRRTFTRMLHPTAFKEFYVQDCLPGVNGTYLEIGVRAGDSLKYVKAARRIGVDPVIGTSIRQLRDTDELHRMTSDAFFDGQGCQERRLDVDVALIDGLHAFRQVVRDVVNSARNLHSGGFIILDDCNPQSSTAASAQQCEGDWNGDVWKAMSYFVNLLGKQDAVTIDADHGVGILRWNSRLAEDPIEDQILKYEELTYGDLEENRKDLLHLLGPNDWPEWRRG